MNTLDNEPILSNEEDADGNSSQLTEPFHVYSTHNLYDVTLTVETNNGCSEDMTRMVEIYPFRVCVAVIPFIQGAFSFANT